MLNRFKIAVVFISLGVSHLLAPSTTLYAQYVDTVHVTDTQHEWTFGFNWAHHKLTSVASLQDTNWNLYGWNYLEFKQYDQNFNVILEKRYQDSNFTYLPFTSLEYHQDAIYLPGYKQKCFNSDSSTAFLIKYDTSGNIIWEKNYYSNAHKGRLLFVTPRVNDLIIVGTENTPASNTINTIVNSIDTSGAILWTKIYTGSYQSAFSYKSTSDGGGIMSTNYQINNTNYKRTAIYKLDANGNTQWLKIIGYQAPFQGPTIESVAAVIEMPDGNFLCYGWKDDYQNGSKRSWLVKLSSNGNVLKDTVFDFSDGYDIFNISSTPLFTETGFYLEGTVYNDISANYSKNQLCFFDYDLNLQWSRKYWKRESENVCNPIKKLDNGYIVLAGFVFPDSPNNTADEWFMVLDSMGCETELCANSLGIYESMYQYTNAYTISIYPNPAQDEVYFALNEHFNYERITYQIIDITGKIVTQGITQPQQAIGVSKLPNGYYVVSLLLDGNRINKPLIVNR
jgi:hypothetical protein